MHFLSKLSWLGSSAGFCNTQWLKRRLSVFAPKCWWNNFPPVSPSLSSNWNFTIRPSCRKIHATTGTFLLPWLQGTKVNFFQRLIIHTLGHTHRFFQFRMHLTRIIRQFILPEDNPTLYKWLFGSALYLVWGGRRTSLSGGKTLDNLTTLSKEILTPSPSQFCFLTYGL